jgi:hypothetical protein
MCRRKNQRPGRDPARRSLVRAIVDVTEIDGVEGVDRLSGPELEERITRAIDPRVPVEVFFALLDRLAVVSRSEARAAAAEPGVASGLSTVGIAAAELRPAEPPPAEPSDLEVDDDGRVV